MKTDLDSSFLDDALDFCGREQRYLVAESLYCAVHNMGQALANNTAGNDQEWLARRLYEEWIRHRPGPDTWDQAIPEHRELFSSVAATTLKVIPELQQRVAARLIELAKVLQDMERVERQQHDRLKKERKL